MAFDSFFFAKLDNDDKDKRLEEEIMGELGKAGNADILLGALFHLYSSPDGFCFKGIGCSDKPIKDDKFLEDCNVDERIDEFIQQ